MRDEEQEPTARSRRAWTGLAGLTLGAILIGGVLLVATGPRQAAPAMPGPPVQAGKTGESPRGCPRTAVRVQRSVLPESAWTLIGSVAAPSDDVNGPAKKDRAGYRHCWAHTTTGALYAATEFLAVGTSPLRGPGAIRRYMADTPDRAPLLSDPRNREALDAEGRFQIRGFRVELADRDRAVLDLALGVDGASSYAFVTMAMRWEDGDWKVVATPTGEFSGGTITDLGGYTEWGGA